MDNYFDLLDFLQNCVEREVMKFHTARTRKTAIKQVFHGSSFENESVLTLDIDTLMNDFIQRSHQEIKTDTIKTYKSRITRSIEDYIRVIKLGENLTAKEMLPKASLIKNLKTIGVTCPIREGNIDIEVSNIPIDLTEQELEKLITLIRLSLS
jgi:methyl coenzyme M reductase gamma subunit